MKLADALERLAGSLQHLLGVDIEQGQLVLNFSEGVVRGVEVRQFFRLREQERHAEWRANQER